MKNFLTFLLILLFIESGFLCKNSFAQENSLKVMTFNIRYDNPDDGENNWVKRRNKVTSMIRFYEPDIVGTQEALIHQKEYLEKMLSNYSTIGVGRTDGKDKGEYSAIFFKEGKYEVINQGTFWLSETPEVIGSVGWDAALERICTWGEFKEISTNNKFFVFNTHFDHIGEGARLSSSKLFISRIKELSKSSSVIITGDFNFTNSSEAYWEIVNNKTYKLFDAQFKSVESHHGPSWTFHGFNEDRKNKPKIDYVFVCEKIKVLKHAVLSDKFDEGYPSDHLPVLAELVIN